MTPASCHLEKAAILCGAQGILVRRTNHCRLAISLDPIRRSMSLENDEADVMPVC
jgi:hypothetical protein